MNFLQIYGPVSGARHIPCSFTSSIQQRAVNNLSAALDYEEYDFEFVRIVST